MMQIKILSALWGYDQYNLTDILEKIRLAGYDGIDTPIPEDGRQKEVLYNYLDKFDLCLVAHQHQAGGKTFEEFKESFLHYLDISSEHHPVLINSHTGRDYFSFEQNLELIDIAQNFSKEKNIPVAHETHRGRFGYGPSVTNDYFKVRPDLKITADFSHWTCVTESFLENFTDTLQEAITRTKHVHARTGFEEGPQVSDPRAPEWKHAMDHFFNWWDQIVELNNSRGEKLLTFTTEFGPPPYLPTVPFTNKPVADQFEINSYMKDLLKERYVAYFP